jgi:hypothetical protein
MCTFIASVFLGYLSYVIISGSPIFRRETPLNPLLPTNSILTEPIIPVDAQAINFSQFDDYDAIFEEFFIVRENNGRIGVFHSVGGVEYFLYNIHRPITLLPEADQELMRQGIVAYTREELTMLEEDFSS